jgi:phosphopantothenoylcysteine synthetase/decarboxylase
VGAATFKALSLEPVAIDLFDQPNAPVHHISLAKEASAFVIAPCTANVINKIANGVADDLLTTTALATKAPLLLAPAANSDMLSNSITQDALATLKARGVQIIEPGSGYLACGDEGVGRLADVAIIAAAVQQALARSTSLQGKRVLITAGPTREFLDPVRYISCPSSGITGYALVEEAERRGAEVTLVSGPVNLPAPANDHVIKVTTAQQMLEATSPHFATADIAIFSAAVADFKPKTQAPQKLKKTSTAPASLMCHPERRGEASESKDLRTCKNGDPSTTLPTVAPLRMTLGTSPRLGEAEGERSEQNILSSPRLGEAEGERSSRNAGDPQPPAYTLELTPNPDILATLAANKNNTFVVGFAAETENVVANAQAKLAAKNADLIIANDVSDPSLGFASKDNKVWIIDATSTQETAILSKKQLASLILDTIIAKLC